MCILIYLMAVIEHTVGIPFHLVLSRGGCMFRFLTILGIKLQQIVAISESVKQFLGLNSNRV